MDPLPPSRLNRAKTDADIIEHVLEGVQTDTDSPRVHSDLGLRPWLGGVIASAVQVQVLPGREEDSDSDANE